ncbi:hypothetical protein DV872_25265 [Oceanispirochaeta sp. M1]|nr:hypothetical protein DV872_25265 [Oceanispirochaeta sp. M1]
MKSNTKFYPKRSGNSIDQKDEIPIRTVTLVILRDLSIKRESKENKLTFVGLWGDYILKPQVEHYRQLPENEFLTMCLADLYQIRTFPRIRPGAYGSSVDWNIVRTIIFSIPEDSE